MLERNLINVTKSFTLNIFEDYRIEILDYLHEVKKNAINHLPKANLRAPTYLLMTVIHHIFNRIQMLLNGYHQNLSLRFLQYDDILFTKHYTLLTQEEHILVRHLEQVLHEYEKKVTEMKGGIRKALLMMYRNRHLKN